MFPTRSLAHVFMHEYSVSLALVTPDLVNLASITIISLVMDISGSIDTSNNEDLCSEKSVIYDGSPGPVGRSCLS